MKRKAFNLIATLLVLTTSQAGATDKTTLDQVTVFSLGFNGFTAKILPEQYIFEERLRQRDAVSYFSQLLNNRRATPEGKAYAVCGLWRKKALPPNLEQISAETQDVTLLRGDVLNQYAFQDVVRRIKTQGC